VLAAIEKRSGFRGAVREDEGGFSRQLEQLDHELDVLGVELGG
jgi:hypothetical protein